MTPLRNTPLQNLILLRNAVAGGQPLQDETRWWLLAGLEKAFRGDAVSLDAALGLSGRGVRRLPTLLAQGVRDAALARAARYMPPDATLEDFAGEVRRFERRRWPVWRNHDAAPAHATAMEAALHSAFRAVRDVPAGVPSSAKQLGRIVDMKCRVFMSSSGGETEVTPTTARKTAS